MTLMKNTHANIEINLIFPSVISYLFVPAKNSIWLVLHISLFPQFPTRMADTDHYNVLTTPYGLAQRLQSSTAAFS